MDIDDVRNRERRVQLEIGAIGMLAMGAVLAIGLRSPWWMIIGLACCLVMLAFSRRHPE